MAITVTEAAFEPRSVSMGPVKIQLVEIVALSGATSGTCTASRLREMYNIILPGIKSQTAAPTFSANVATLAFTVPAETAASETIDGVLYTAQPNQGLAGNSITVELVDGTGDLVPVVPGSEVVEVSGSAIVVRIDPTAITGSSTLQVETAVNASPAASALVIASGGGATVATVTAATPLAGGINGGYRGTAICVGR